MNELVLRNRQRARRVDLAVLRRIAGALFAEFPRLPSYAVGIHLVGAREMARLNERHLRHEGSTDVITFGYGPDAGAAVGGDIVVCLDEAAAQARRYHTSWPAELVRYVVHGALHLQGYDDQRPGSRRIMKREEDRLVRRLSRCFNFSELARIELTLKRG
jgi:probable rRNA maturation factor